MTGWLYLILYLQVWFSSVCSLLMLIYVRGRTRMASLQCHAVVSGDVYIDSAVS
jgi:hypothetical protein